MRPTTRRDFLQGLSASAIAAASYSPAFSVSELVDGQSAQSGPHIHFPKAPRDRVSVSTYPFRECIVGAHGKHAAGAGKMPLKDFPAQVVAKFNVHKIEPWSEHFVSLEPAYLDELRSATEKAGCSFANIAADQRDSFYAAGAGERGRAIQFGRAWIDVAARIDSPSVRLNIAQAKDAKPDVEVASDALKQVAEYAATKNVAVHLENDNGVSEDPAFLVSVIERVKSEWLHALPDFGNSLAHLHADEAYRGLDQLFAHAYAISHVKDTTTSDAGAEVQVDMARIFALAKKHNFAGIFSMEWETAGDVYAGTASLIATTTKNLS